MLLSDVIGGSRVILADITPATWADSEMIESCNQAEPTVVSLVPGSNPVAVDFTLVANDAKQSFASTPCYRLIKPVRNTGADGATPGRAITFANAEELHRWDRDWMSSTAAAVIQHVVYDPRVPKEFFIYPRASAGLHIELKVDGVPTKRAVVGDSFTIGAEYRTPLIHFVVGLSLSKLDEDAFGKMAKEWMDMAVAECNALAAANQQKDMK